MKESEKIKSEEEFEGLDWRLQSIEGIIGYLSQSIKMDHEPQRLLPIILFLAKEVKNSRKPKQIKTPYSDSTINFL